MMFFKAESISDYWWIWVALYTLVWLGLGVLVYWGISKLKDKKDRVYAAVAAILILGSIFVLGILMAGSMASFMETQSGNWWHSCY